MSEHVSQTILLVQQQIQDLERQLAEKRRMVNSLCTLVGQPALYPEVDQSSSGLRPVRADEYYGQPLATAIRMVLDRRQASNLGPASVNEIYDALISGGYKFDAKTEDYSKRGLYSALTKNSATFHKLPNSLYGLLSWYPNVRVPKPAKPSNDDSNVVEAEQESPFNSEEQSEEVSVPVAVGAEQEREESPRRKAK